MKKLITILAVFALFCAYAQSQTATITKVLAANQTYYEYTPSAAQYIGGANGYDTLYFEILTNKHTPVNCNARVEVASRKGTTDTYDVDLEGKIFANSTYAAIEANSAVTASTELTDTTSYLALPSAYYRYYRVIVNGDDAPAATTDSLTLSKVIFKIYQR